MLIDTSPDLREQMLAAQVDHMDAVWFTHDHADHTHGIDDIRPFYLTGKKRVQTFADVHTMRTMESRFGYCFLSSNEYPAIAELNEITPYQTITAFGVGGEVTALPIPVRHGSIDALCFRFGGAAYMPDVNGLPDAAKAELQGLDLLIIDALRYKRHPSHYSLDETLAVITELKPKRSVITNMHVDLDYETLRRDVPKDVVPAYDGLILEVSDAA